MVTSVYVAASDAASVKSVVALGLMELLTGRLGGAGVFRPVVRAGERDPVVELLRGRYPVPGTYEDSVGVTYDDVHADPENALTTIVERYHALARRCPAVIVVGTDFTDVGAPTEFTFNARVAVNLASPILLVVNGLGRSGHQVASAAELARTELTAAHATVLGVIANRVAADEVPVARQELSGLGVPAYALPEMPRLMAPTVDELMRACDGELLLGEETQLGREASGVLIAAMTLPNVLDHLTEGAAVITPGDRVAILLGLLAAHRSGAFPALSAVFLSGGFAPTRQIGRLAEGLAPRLPVILTHQDTYATAGALAATRGRITANATAKIADALGVFERNVNARTLMDRLEVTRSTAVTPVMFEYELVERARSARRRIVLPEGTEERILRAADILLRRDVADLTLLGDPETVKAQAAELGLDLSGADVVDPADEELRERFADKAVQRSAGAVAVGPVLQGLRRPVNDLSRGATVQDIVNTVAITAAQAQAQRPADDGGNA
ncbi:MAG: AAA family ATPase [Streptosporangiales bacterium]|nr:AAA family ATPase [Streptosporangiales bacterium]